MFLEKLSCTCWNFITHTDFSGQCHCDNDPILSIIGDDVSLNTHVIITPSKIWSCPIYRRLNTRGSGGDCAEQTDSSSVVIYRTIQATVPSAGGEETAVSSGSQERAQGGKGKLGYSTKSCPAYSLFVLLLAIVTFTNATAGQLCFFHRSKVVNIVGYGYFWNWKIYLHHQRKLTSDSTNMCNLQKYIPLPRVRDTESISRSCYDSFSHKSEANSL